MVTLFLIFIGIGVEYIFETYQVSHFYIIVEVILMKVFLAYPFTQLLNPVTGLVDEDTILFLTEIVDELTMLGYEVFSAQKREAFGKELMGADIATKLDLEEMRKADLVIAFPGWNPVSGGVHVELGWASALGKTILIFLHEQETYSPMVEGMPYITNAKLIPFSRPNSRELIKKVVAEVNLYRTKCSLEREENEI
jgi:hypothetical protein